MKKVFTFLSFLLLVAFVLPNVSYGHASNDFRSRCSWWKKRYKSKTRITELGIIPLCIQNRSGCSTVSASCVKNCGIAEARAGASINYVRAISFPSGGLICGAGEGLSQLSKLIIDNREADFGSYEDNISAVSEFYYEQEIDFENRQYMLSNINGKLSIPKNYPGIVRLEISLWKANDDKINFIQDTLMSPDKVFNQQFISIKDNQVLFSEAFKNNPDIVVKETTSEIAIVFSGAQMSFSIPSFVDIDEDFASNITAYSDPDNERIAREKSQFKNKSFTVFPNPNMGAFTIKKSTPVDVAINRIALYNAQGVLINEFGQRAVDRFNLIHAYEFETQNLPAGIYYLNIAGDGIFEVQKVIIQSSN